MWRTSIIVVGAALLAAAACRDSESGASGQAACDADEVWEAGFCVPARVDEGAQAADSGVPARPNFADAGRSGSVDASGPGNVPPATRADAGAWGPEETVDAGTVVIADAGVPETPPVDDFDPNAPGIWPDPDTGLYWENPPEQMSFMLPNYAQAATYCEELTLAGASDWRVPTLDELRTLVRGISTVMPGGACSTSEACADSNACAEDACLGCSGDGLAFTQPGDCALTDTDIEAGRCYWVEGLQGTCTAYWSSTVNTALASAGQARYYLRYTNGIIRSLYGALGNFAVRCVR